MKNWKKEVWKTLRRMKIWRKMRSLKKTVESIDHASEETASAAKNPSFSEDDEWLYSKPRRFAKKPAGQQED